MLVKIFKKGRIYIPQAMLKKYHIEINEEMIEGPSEKFKLLFDELSGIARTYYQFAYDHLDAFFKRCF